ncbi:uncharacterized protein MCYG_02506 [Microsporum canis CBS 113480]|uniref:Uncharacterized protein n=1 Tax=Arthroderma otae (strain ATCC MYA-4605 / CBS 113480) TaxID=554155 RepID=C5FG02_ARTOC|nr:uncharacterized protein MCYG_02506 [Microsporum canis CBS 113480]EEQ29687.1 predicted protein [Microsporum canis CBS 113480]
MIEEEKKEKKKDNENERAILWRRAELAKVKTSKTVGSLIIIHGISEAGPMGGKYAAPPFTPSFEHIFFNPCAPLRIGGWILSSEWFGYWFVCICVCKTVGEEEEHKKKRSKDKRNNAAFYSTRKEEASQEFARRCGYARWNRMIYLVSVALSDREREEEKKNRKKTKTIEGERNVNGRRANNKNKMGMQNIVAIIRIQGSRRSQMTSCIKQQAIPHLSTRAQRLLFPPQLAPRN